jgi:hypothetical protein
VVVEDANGDVELLSFYNFCSLDDGPDWLKPGMIVLVKEPILRYGASGDKSSFLRVDSPSGGQWNSNSMKFCTKETTV